MDRLLTLQAWLWGLLLVLAILAIWSLRRAIRHAQRHPRHEIPWRMQHLTRRTSRTLQNERTLARWSRIVKKSNTAFWAHVSQRQDPKQ
ncbi:hypothetical protein [Paludibacterium purpuratum]|uniref:hypothetical protein n=1 Tax=Paludibacterium purpuratum TaxID=1144873 RepID=UPI00105DB0A9|nr:hypothetical protein [Paludibacterium purpuratum]